jgi:hypothetical protein
MRRFCFTPVTTRLLELIPNVAGDCGLEVVSVVPSTYGGSCDMQVQGSRDNIDTLAANLASTPIRSPTMAISCIIEVRGDAAAFA